MTANLAKAYLCTLSPEDGTEQGKFPVQFNPETLKVSFANQIVPPQNNATDQSQGTASTQFVGRGTTKLSVQLWFDVTAELPDGLADDDAQRGDVRKLTQKVVALITPQPAPNDQTKFLPPAVRFLWGSFQFDGVVESMEQSLEFFSAEGVPLRASFSLSMSQQSIDYRFPQNGPTAGPFNTRSASAPSGAAPGTAPLAQAPAGLSLQAMASIQGKGADWQAIAQANGIENPRLLQPGQLIDMNVSAPRVNVTASTPRASVSGPGFSFSSR